MATSFARLIKQKINKYVELLGIGDYKYKINLVTKPCKSNECSSSRAYATVEIDEETREVYMDIDKKLLMKNPKEIDRTLIHELLHVRFSEFLNFNYRIMRKYIKNKKARDAFDEQLELLEHKIIVSLTEALNDNGKK
ncbi:MAG: hypothetical protein R3321_14835 [Nitrososphaeraceae archaeon]|nr:hypothetical protein [Nitrososphaeraceae archaeon]